jgi:hypothetical protein
MTIEAADVQLDPGTARKGAVRAALLRDFHIDAAFVGVPKLARILGLAPSTIYAHVRAGVFFIPHRMMNTTTMFLVDDVVDWICREPERAAPSARAQETAQAPAKTGDYTSAVVAKALREMGLSRGARRQVSGGRP